MVDKKISELTELTTVDDAADFIPIVDTSATETKKVKPENIGLSASATATFTNKTFDADGTGNSITNIEDADIKAGAAIAQSKLSLDITNSEINASAAIDATKIADGSVTSTEFQYINTLSSNAQTQLDAKAPLASPTFTGTVAIPNYANVETTLDGIATKAPLASPTFTGTVTTATLDVAGNNIDNIQNLIHDISTTTTALDFSGDQLQTISISANTTFTTSNRATGKTKTIKITTDGSTRTLTFPAWKFVGTKPTDQAASKVGILTVTCFGTADTDIVAAYAVEE
uniref:Uncharacterized protein n=1 Tax=Yangshan Harbor Nitrososphaeria virus TaxID=2969597 RepID=A0A976UB48_9CAUD|nr:hypothetical protein [Yangshan Harbor Nitrososphaeria virus]